MAYQLEHVSYLALASLLLDADRTDEAENVLKEAVRVGVDGADELLADLYE